MYYNNYRKSCGNRLLNKRIPLSDQEIKEQYMVALQKLYEQHDLGSILFLRLAEETGFRLFVFYDFYLYLR